MQAETQHYEFYNDPKNHTNYVSQTSKLDESIRNIVLKEGYISCDVNKKMIAADGGNYLGTLYEIDIKGKTTDGDKETAIFVKSRSLDATIEIISLPSVYKTELFVYNEMTKIFDELQNEGNVPVNERYNTVKCYEESNDESIIMENLTRKEFKTWYRMDIVTLEMAEVCVKQLAKFHALSFVIEQQRPEYFNNKIKTLQTAYTFGNTWKAFIEKISKIGLEFLDEGLRSKTEEKLPGILEKLKDYCTDESTKYCLCHGDYRPNNIMAKEVNGKLTEVIPVDYQMIYYGCPIIDFFYFIYISTNRQFRNLHMVNLKNLYYKSFERFLQYFDISAEGVFPRRLFENLYKDKLDYGLAVTFLVCPFIFIAEDGEIPDVTKKEVMEKDFKFDDRFKDRLKDAVEEFIELGYF